MQAFFWRSLPEVLLRTARETALVHIHNMLTSITVNDILSVHIIILQENEVNKMVTKTIQLEFADPSVRAIDYIQDIRKAAEYAGLNLYSRYDVRLQHPMPTPDNNVIVDIMIPDEIADTFSIGNHLRGVSAYLLSKCGDRYQKFLVGKRLLYYTEVSDESFEPMGLAMVDRLEAIVEFTKLLERSDDEALDQIRRMMAILKEPDTVIKFGGIGRGQ